MAGFWYPYADLDEARTRLCAFADAPIGPQCGVSFSNGTSICVLRQPSGSASRGHVWLNVLTQHVSIPPPPPPPSRGGWGKLSAFFWHVMESQAEADFQESQASLAMNAAVEVTLEKHIWLPMHEFLLRHKLVADGVGVAMDAVGVVAGTAFLVSAAPEIIGGTVVVGTAGLVTGSAAFLG